MESERMRPPSQTQAGQAGRTASTQSYQGEVRGRAGPQELCRLLGKGNGDSQGARKIQGEMDDLCGALLGMV
ncbi:hypothetical protein TREES_T100020521 [Tupaia chinensis]|uniref:Uncharacterized protein n=1 Tax=Tupaia chinensis TaxID=246437 RepID=L9KVH7_TUPCH|nr:hypothetical protein TREES_T100020521 [Tupaia chinensis]